MPKKMLELPSFVTNKLMPEFSGLTEDVAAIVARGLTKTEEHDRKGRLWASDSAFCPRQAVLNSSIKNTSTHHADFDLYVELGKTIENRILWGLHQENRLLIADYKLPDFGLNMGGKVDGIALVNKKIRILEIKSCGDLPTSPRGYQQSQALLYSAVLGLKSSLVYQSRSVADFRGVLKMRQFDLDLDGDGSRRTLFYAAYSKFANDMGVLPNIPYSITKSSQCGFCKYVNACFGEEKLPTKIPLVNSSQEIILIQQSNDFVEEFMKKKNTSQRREILFEDMRKFGTEAARKLLSEVDCEKYY